MSYPDPNVVRSQLEAAQRAIDRLHAETERLRALLEYQALTDKSKPSWQGAGANGEGQSNYHGQGNYEREPAWNSRNNGR